MRNISVLLGLLLFTSLTIFAQSPVEDGNWHGDVQLNDSVNLGFTFTVKDGKMVIENSDERIEMSDMVVSEDSIFVRFPYYDSELRFTSIGPILSGEFVNHAKLSNNVFYFRAMKDFPYRNVMNAQTTYSVEGRWELFFDGEEGVNRSNVAVLKQKGSKVTGTVMTPTGDHRFLDGELNGNRLLLSTFNGAFLMVYRGEIMPDGTLRGSFYSGKTGYDTWTAFRNPNASLPDPSSLTFLKPGSTKFDFDFPDMAGKRWTMNDERFRNNVTVVQLMGTWCPNCLDETVFLNEYYTLHRGEGLEMIGIDFERITDSARVHASIDRICQRLQISYPIVYGGNSNRDSSSAALPMLSKVFAYPTTLFIDKKGAVRKIHTGFSGPAAAAEYDAYRKDFDVFVKKLMAE